MTSNITVFKSYLKGTKTVVGNFPVYINNNISSDGSNICDKIDTNYQTEQLTEELLKEIGVVGLVTQESDDVNTVLIVIQKEDLIPTYIEM
jgi:hypothetical protein